MCTPSLTNLLLTFLDKTKYNQTYLHVFFHFYYNFWMRSALLQLLEECSVTYSAKRRKQTLCKMFILRMPLVLAFQQFIGRNKQTNNQTTTTTKQNIKHNNKMTEWLLAHNQYATYIWINSIVIDLCANTKKQQWKKKNVQFDNV